MPYKKIIPLINTEGEVSANVIQMAKKYSNGGADELLIYNFSKDEKSREEFLKLAKQISRVIDVPFIIGSYVDNFDDIKRALYTGATGVLFPFSLLTKPELIKEASSRFGANRIYLAIEQSIFMATDNIYDQCRVSGIGNLIINTKF